VIEPQYDSADAFAGGLAVVSMGDTYGYIDGSGQMVIEPSLTRLTVSLKGWLW
jgi:hypothetical protein